MKRASHPHLGFSSFFCPSGFTTEILCAFLIFPVCAACCAHVILLMKHVIHETPQREILPISLSEPNTVEPNCSDIGLCDTFSVASYIVLN